MSELVKLMNSGNELTAEGELRTLVASLAQHLHSATVKHADDTVCEFDFVADAMGSLAPRTLGAGGKRPDHLREHFQPRSVMRLCERRALARVSARHTG